MQAIASAEMLKKLNKLDNK